MPMYRIEVVDNNGHLIDREEIGADDDKSAIKMLPDIAPIYSDAVAHAKDPVVKLYRQEAENWIFVAEIAAAILVLVPPASQPA